MKTKTLEKLVEMLQIKEEADRILIDFTNPKNCTIYAQVQKNLVPVIKAVRHDEIGDEIVSYLHNQY